MISKQLKVGSVSLSDTVICLDESQLLSRDPIMTSSEVSAFVASQLSNVDTSQLSNLSGVARVYVGKDVEEYLSAGNHRKLSNDLVWFDTNESPEQQSYDIRRMDSLQAQIYRLGLQVRDVVKVVENGVIPGGAYDNTKDEMVAMADFVEPPEDSKDSSLSLLGMSVYGNYWCRNKELYYIMFDPAGYVPKSTDHFTWQISGHDAGAPSVRTISKYDAGTSSFYSLKVQVGEAVLSSTARVCMSACVYLSGSTPSYVTDQDTVNEVIDFISADGKFSFAVTSDIKDYDNQAISSDWFDAQPRRDESVHQTPTMSIAGSDYIDVNNFQLYGCTIDDTVKKFPLNVSTRWFFLSSFNTPSGLSSAKSDTYVHEVLDDDDSTKNGKVVYTIQHGYGSPVCQVSAFNDGCELTSIKDVSVSLYVESNYDNALSAMKTIRGVGGEVPNLDVEPTVKAVCAKVDKKTNLAEKSATLYDGEMVFFSDTNQFAVWNLEKQQFQIMNSSESAGLSKEEIQSIGLNYLDFTASPDGTVRNKLAVDSRGKIMVCQHDTNAGFITSTDDGVFVSSKLQIGKVYCGGKAITHKQIVDRKKNPKSFISHNFVEIVNASDSDISLDQTYLMYHTTDDEFRPNEIQSGSSGGWEFLKLSGIIKAGGTYLVRGACCNPDRGATLLIDGCDIEWRKRTATDKDILSESYSEFERTGGLMEFSQERGSFFLCESFKNSDGKTHGGNILKVLGGADPATLLEDKSPETRGYIDLVGMSTAAAVDGTYAKGTKYTPPGKNSFDNLLFYRWFYMDPASQAKNGYSKRDNQLDMTCVDFERHASIYDGISNKRDKFYYGDEQKRRMKPGVSTQNDGMFSVRSHFKLDTPNMVNITFGRQATAKVGGVKASRCFNWISIGYYDEFVKFRKVVKTAQGKTYGEWSKAYYSITKDTVDSDYGVPVKGDGYDFHEFYDRHVWVASDGTEVTTHKAILKNAFDAGVYEYVIGRRDDSKYVSEEMEFTVRSDDEVNASFSFIQTSDQQGFNFIEYQAWKAACKGIATLEPDDFDFTINTGDVAQSGNRVSEWLDYYDGRKAMRGKEEMFTIGNNDLCGKSETILGNGNDKTSKFNLVNIKHYYAFELDPANDYIYSTFEDGNAYPLYSLYSFDYGKWHFVSLVSEIRDYYYNTFTAEENLDVARRFSAKLNSDVENWFLKDLTLYMERSGESDCRRCVVFMHEMPFTIVTTTFFAKNDATYGKYGRSVRSEADPSKGTGCKLNLENGKGNYRISRLFKKAGIRLVIGGHKHTFSLSNPLFDAAEVVSADANIPLSNSIGTATGEDPFMSGEIGGDGISAHIPNGREWSRKPVVEMPIDGVVRYLRQKNATLSACPEISADLTDLISRDIPSERYFSEKVEDIVKRSKDAARAELDPINVYNTDLSSWLRINYVSAITAPTMVMTQATGYKVVSNKELPAPTSDTVTEKITYPGRYIPWLMSYCAANKVTGWSAGKPKSVQKRTTYARYDFSENSISVQLKQIDGVLDIKINDKGADTTVQQFNLDMQDKTLSVLPVTFGYYGKNVSAMDLTHMPTTLSAYETIYGDYIGKDADGKNTDTYIIKL